MSSRRNDRNAPRPEDEPRFRGRKTAGIRPGVKANRGADRDGGVNDQTGNTYRTRATMAQFPRLNSVAHYESFYEAYKQNKREHMDHKCFDFVVRLPNIGATAANPASMTQYLKSGDFQYNNYSGSSITPTSVHFKIICKKQQVSGQASLGIFMVRFFQWREASTPPTATDLLTGNAQSLGGQDYTRVPNSKWRDNIHYLAEFRGVLNPYEPNTVTTAGAQLYMERYIQGDDMIPIIADNTALDTIIKGNIFYVVYSNGTTGTSGMDIQIQMRCTFTDDVRGVEGG